MGKTFQYPVLSNVTIWEHQLFSGLTQSQQLWLSERIEQKTAPAKSTIFKPDDPGTQLYYLLEGTVKTEVLPGDKNWLIRDIHSPHEFFGLNGLFGQNLRREYARTLRTAAKIMVIQNTDLRCLMEVNYDFCEEILTLTASPIKLLERRAISLTEKTANTRFADFLIGRLEKEGSFDGTSWFYDSHLTQEEIGAYIGTGRQTVTEILADLKSKNILSYNWGKFWVYDLEGLKIQKAG